MVKSISILCLIAAAPSAFALTQDEVNSFVKNHVNMDEGFGSHLQFEYKEVRMALISDRYADRMRIIAPVTKVKDMTNEQLHAAMESNFHSALDARYASSDGTLYSAFIHPLSPLTEDQLQSALDQVAALASTYGTSYSSGSLRYYGGGMNLEESDSEELDTYGDTYGNTDDMTAFEANEEEGEDEDEGDYEEDERQVDEIHLEIQGEYDEKKYYEEPMI